MHLFIYLFIFASICIDLFLLSILKQWFQACVFSSDSIEVFCFPPVIYEHVKPQLIAMLSFPHWMIACSSRSFDLLLCVCLLVTVTVCFCHSENLGGMVVEFHPAVLYKILRQVCFNFWIDIVRQCPVHCSCCFSVISAVMERDLAGEWNTVMHAVDSVRSVRCSSEWIDGGGGLDL